MWTELVMLKVRRNKPSVIYAQDEISGFCQDRSADMTRPRSVCESVGDIQLLVISSVVVPICGLGNLRRVHFDSLKEIFKSLLQFVRVLIKIPLEKSSVSVASDIGLKYWVSSTKRSTIEKEVESEGHLLYVKE